MELTSRSMWVQPSLADETISRTTTFPGKKYHFNEIKLNIMAINFSKQKIPETKKQNKVLIKYVS